MPRKLIVLHFNDDPEGIAVVGRVDKHGGQPSPRADGDRPRPPAEGEGRRLDHPTRLAGSILPAGLDADTFPEPLKQWKDVLDLWSELGRGSMPDIIISDIRFNKDDTTPLNFGQSPQRLDIPTGLSHAKPFVAIARVFGRPIGVGIYSYYRNLWREKVHPAHGGEDTRMALLAAHEAGEIMAMLGARTEVDARKPCTIATVESCWNWIESSTEETVAAACGHALEMFRLQLLRYANETPAGGNPTLFVLPDDWAALREWCTKMEASPQVLDLNTNDPGLPYILDDGRKDCLYLSSLFCDAKTDLHHVPLRNDCFALVNMPHPERLNPSTGLPMIGAFIEKLAFLNAAYELAVKAVFVFPDELPAGPNRTLVPENLNDKVPVAGSGRLARALVVVFQVLRAAKKNWERWSDSFALDEWDAADRSLTGLRNPSKSLEAFLKHLALHISGDIRRASAPFTTRSELLYVDAWDQPWHGAVVGEEYRDWYLRLLIESGLLEVDKSGGGFKTTSSSCSTPSVPVGGFGGPGMIGIGGEIWRYLRDSLGFGDAYSPGAVNDGAIRDKLWQGFGLADAQTTGRPRAEEFLNQFLEGRGPEWLKALCQYFVQEELGWDDRKGWPRSISG